MGLWSMSLRNKSFSDGQQGSKLWWYEKYKRVWKKSRIDFFICRLSRFMKGCPRSALIHFSGHYNGLKFLFVNFQRTRVHHPFNLVLYTLFVWTCSLIVFIKPDASQLLGGVIYAAYPINSAWFTSATGLFTTRSHSNRKLLVFVGLWPAANNTVNQLLKKILF